MSELNIIEIGSEVLLDGEIPATITAVSIRGVEHRVSYECTWWDERTRKCEWVDPFEIIPKDSKLRSLKFFAVAHG